MKLEASLMPTFSVVPLKCGSLYENLALQALLEMSTAHL